MGWFRNVNLHRIMIHDDKPIGNLGSLFSDKPIYDKHTPY